MHSPHRSGAQPLAGFVSARAAPKTPNGAEAAPKAPAKERIDRRENPLRFASGRPFVEFLLIWRAGMASLSKTECGSNQPIGTGPLRARPWVASPLGSSEPVCPTSVKRFTLAKKIHQDSDAAQASNPTPP